MPRIPGQGLGSAFAITAALLFGLTAPLSKLFLTGLPPIEASGLLYTSAGLALACWKAASRLAAPASASRREAPIAWTDWPYIGGAIVFGGLLGPTLLLVGLAHATGTAASLLLNLESVFTVLLALVFGESLSRRPALGIGAILVGGVFLAVDPTHVGGSTWLGILAIAGACACWALDNNLTQRLSGRDPATIVAIKGLVAGPVALLLAFAMGAHAPSFTALAAAAVLGASGYGLSLLLFVLALRHAGTARTGGLFATAPFAGAIASIVILHETPSWITLAAGLAMAVGVALMLTEQHGHEHTHEELAHEHAHVHDAHHQHEHEGWEGPEPHSHPHTHAPLTHTHSHQPDAHHRHAHD